MKFLMLSQIFSHGLKYALVTVFDLYVSENKLKGWMHYSAKLDFYLPIFSARKTIIYMKFSMSSQSSPKYELVTVFDP